MSVAGSAGTARPHLSVVVPVYGCERLLHELHRRLVATLEPLTQRFEIVLVNDASFQGDWAVIEQLAARDPRVRGIDFSRNFGQHIAITAGLDAAEGDWVVVMDCDLQDRPEEIATFYATVQQGYHGVFGRRVQRKDGLLKRAASRAFYALFGYFVGMRIDPTVGNFSMLSRRVVEAYRRFGERNRNYALNVHWLGFRLAYVAVDHAARADGGTGSYSLRALLRFALQTVLFQSNKPLVISASIGVVMALGALLYGAYLVLRAYLHGVPVPGWTSVMVSLYLLAGITFLILGVIGTYLGSVYLEVKQRPLYVIRQTTDERRGGDS